ncbi:hypothetical protein LH61_08770 [Leuconostoc mesenteroides P45]|nr:5'-nucleotidase [Leuconostoc mesenteroides]KGB49779.1 hypothetical protein LH61_08770 [Leuconostoc mesenteroides P45]
MRLKLLSGLIPFVFCGLMLTSGPVIYADVQVANNTDSYSKPSLEPDYQKTDQSNSQDIAVQPFGNVLQVVEMTGEQIRQALNEQYDQNQQYYLQIAGLTYTYEKNNNENQRYIVKEIHDSKGQLVSDNQTYRVVINDFLHGAGDNFYAFKDTKIIGALGTDTDTFIKYIKAMTKTDHKVVAPVLDRKKFIE